jgi:hypothetical protein
MTGGVNPAAPPPLNLDENRVAAIEEEQHAAAVARADPDELIHGQFNSSHPLFADIAPSDLYNEQGIYWADLPFSQRSAWVNKQMNDETIRELRVVGAMAKADPLSPLTAYCSRYVIGGFGLFTEGYT